MNGRQRGAGQAKRRREAAGRDALKMADARLVSAGPGPDGKGFLMTLTAAEEVIQHMAAAMATMFEGNGATNYVEIQVSHRTKGPFVLTLHKKFGKTPHQLRREAEAERDALRAENETLRAARRA